MTNLKTLKDIYGNDFDNSLLRQEAIKWVKRKETFGFDPYCCDDSVRDWIKHFFNLTEKELAGGEE